MHPSEIPEEMQQAQSPLWGQDLPPHGVWLILAQDLNTRKHKLSPRAFPTLGPDPEGEGHRGDDASGPCLKCCVSFQL